MTLGTINAKMKMQVGGVRYSTRTPVTLYIGRTGVYMSFSVWPTERIQWDDLDAKI
jgi:hypothetical protein